MAASAAVKKQPAPAPKAAEAQAANEAPAEAPKKKSKLLLIVAACTVLGALGGGAAWYFLGSHGGGEGKEAKAAAAKPPVFLPLDQFTVNLQPEDGAQYLQVAVTLKVTDQAVVDAVKLHMPDIRSRVLLLLSSKKPSEVASLEGKQKLADEISEQVSVPIAQQFPPRPKPAETKKEAAAAPVKGAAPAKSEGKAEGKSADPAANNEPERGVVSVFFTHFIVQ